MASDQDEITRLQVSCPVSKELVYSIEKFVRTKQQEVGPYTQCSLIAEALHQYLHLHGALREHDDGVVGRWHHIVIREADGSKKTILKNGWGEKI